MNDGPQNTVYQMELEEESLFGEATALEASVRAELGVLAGRVASLSELSGMALLVSRKLEALDAVLRSLLVRAATHSSSIALANQVNKGEERKPFPLSTRQMKDRVLRHQDEAAR